jgi:hypothetical protein
MTINITWVKIQGIVILQKWIRIRDVKKAVLRIRFGFYADPDPDPAFYLNADRVLFRLHVRKS